VVGPFVYGNEPWDSIKGQEFFAQLRDSAPRSESQQYLCTKNYASETILLYKHQETD
jgi:hypothetical protein